MQVTTSRPTKDSRFSALPTTLTTSRLGARGGLHAPDFPQTPKLEVIVRRAVEQDAARISHLAKSVELKDLKAENLRKSGFLVRPQTEQVYKERVNLSRHCYVVEIDGKVEGYATAYDREELVKVSSRMSYQDRLVDFVLSRPGDILFLDQFVVSPEVKGKRLSLELHEKLVSSSEGRNMYGAVLCEPVRNAISVWFFRSRGWSYLEAIEQRDERWNSLKWAMYTLDNQQEF